MQATSLQVPNAAAQSLVDGSNQQQQQIAAVQQNLQNAALLEQMAASFAAQQQQTQNSTGFAMNPLLNLANFTGSASNNAGLMNAAGNLRK